MDVSLLKNPKNSHRKKVILPRRSNLFAEFMGIMLGDGGINNEWQANITVNAIADKKYVDYVSHLCLQLFGIVPAIRQRKTKQATVISLASTSVVDFLVAQGLPRGNKLFAGLKIPLWIMENREYQRVCVRGLVDTDGCLYIHKHIVAGKQYRNLGFCFTSYSPELVLQVASILEENGIKPAVPRGGRNVYLYRAESIQKYLRIFGSSNERITSVLSKLEASDSGLFHRLGKAAYRKVP
jgi:hypothetical protein